MKLIVTKDYAEMSTKGAEIVASIVRTNPRAVLGLTTGNTPMGLYSELVERHKSGTLPLNDVRVFCTEEYLGTGPDDYHALFSWLHRTLIAPCGLPPSNVFRLHAEAAEPQLACQEFEAAIHRAGGLDLLVEGIGINGHVGFNEPGSLFDSPTRVLALTDGTVEYNSNYWDATVPRYGLTIGLGTILAAKSILLLASGESKAEPLARALTGPVTPEVPASVLQRASHLIVVADQEAASLLRSARVRNEV